METNKSNQEDSNQVIQDKEQGGSQVRSYECIFCKRGFSNAQALGGHMNIHRKHKAKLKYSTSNEPHQHQQSLHMISKNIEAKSSEDTIKWPWILDKESDTSKNNNIHVGEIQQLSLFVDKPTSTKDQDQHHHQEQEHEEQQPSKLHGIDLELRLGPEPQDSWPATGTKRFF